MRLFIIFFPTALLATVLAFDPVEPAEPPAPEASLWASLWSSGYLHSYTSRCAPSYTFHAGIYSLKNLYPTLKTRALELKVFYNKVEYPGS
jgi:hypothetical protein